MSGGQRPARLEADDVIRFHDGEHFLEELTGNLGRGRAFVQTDRSLSVNSRLTVILEAPGASETVTLEATVVFAREGFAGLELKDFENQLESLDRLGQLVEETLTSPLAKEPTPLPPSAFMDDESATGPLIVPEEVQRVATSATSPSSDDLTAALSAYLGDQPLPEPVERHPETPPVSPTPSPRPRGDTVIAPPPPFEADEAGLDDAEFPPEPETSPDVEGPTLELTDLEPSTEEPAGVPPPGNGDLLDVPTPTDPLLREPHSEASPPDESPSPEPPAEAPTLDASDRVFADGLDALDALPVLRASPGGAVRLAGSSQLLGAWLLGLEHGLLTVHGGPEAALGETVSLKLVAGRVVTVEAQVRARVGPWLTVWIEERNEIRELLEEKNGEWSSELASLGMAAAPPAEPVSAAMPAKPAASEPPPAPTLSDRPTAPLSNPSLAVGPQSSTHVAISRRQLPEPTDPDAPPLPPRLEGNRVVFRHSADLRKELEADLERGGLFVDSAPLPLYSKHQLVLVVGDVEIPGIVEADVVFADGGKVGFSVPGAAALGTQLRDILVEGLPAATSEDGSKITSDLGGRGSTEGCLSPPPPVEKILDLESSRTGDLEGLNEPSVLSLFDELVSSRFKGVLRLNGDAAERKVYFHEGNVAFLESSPFEEITSLGRILAQHRRVSESALRTALDKAKRAQTPLGRSLISLGFAKSGDIVSALREQTRSRIEQSFGWRAGAFALGPWEDPPGRGELVVTRGVGILANHLRRRFEQMGVDELEGLLGSSMEMIVKSTDSLERVAGPLGLQAKELRFLQVSIDGRRSMEEAVRLSPVGKLASLRLAAVALSLGLVRTEANSQRSAPRKRSGERSGRLRAELGARLDQLSKQNHFDVLGVHWSSHPRTFADAYQAALTEYGVGQGALPEAPPDVQDIAKACAERVKTAFVVLSDEQQRVSYRNQFYDKSERQFAAQTLVEKGELALMRGDRVTAIEHLESAVELAPSDRHRRLLRSARGQP